MTLTAHTPGCRYIATLAVVIAGCAEPDPAAKPGGTPDPGAVSQDITADEIVPPSDPGALGDGIGTPDIPLDLVVPDTGAQSWIGDSCASDDTCRGPDDRSGLADSVGHCVQPGIGQALICAVPCTGECDGDDSCQELAHPTGSVFVCLPLITVGCASCSTHEDCVLGGARCIASEHGTEVGQFCATACTTSAQCGAGYSCVVAVIGGANETLCRPSSGACTCQEGDDGLSRPCSVAVPGVGECPGEELCSATDGWLGCTALSPTEEVCDGLDNDCDGQTDESSEADCTPASVQVWTVSGAGQGMTDTGAQVQLQIGIPITGAAQASEGGVTVHWGIPLVPSSL